MLFRTCVGVVLALTQMVCVADEKSERRQIFSEVGLAVATRNFAKLEALYAQAKVQPTITSGQHRSGIVMEALDLASRAEGSSSSAQAWQFVEAKGDAWQQAFPTSSLAAYMRSQTRLNRALEVRGTGPAQAVSTATWALFDSHVQKATDALQEAAGSVQQDEVWHTALLKAARYQRLDTPAVKRLLEVAANKYPDYLPLYEAAALRLSTAGGGSAEDLEWVANLASQKSSVRGSVLPYAMVYAAIGQGVLGESLFEMTAVDWKKMRSGFEELIARHPAPANLNNYAWFACRARDQVALAALIKRLGGQLDAERWNSPEGQSACMKLAQAPRSGPGSELVTTRDEFRSLLRNNDFDGIEKMYAQLIAENARTDMGTPRAELFLDISGSACPTTDRFIEAAAWGTPLEREAQAVREARAAACRQRLEAKFLEWQKRFPESSLAAVALSDISLRATDVIPSPPVAVLDAAFERAQAVLNPVPAAKRDLYWHQQRLWVGSLQGWGPTRYKQGLQEAVSRFPDRASLYRRAVTHFLPRNGGSFAEIDAVARTGLAKNDNISTGLLMYAHAYDEVAFGRGDFHELTYQQTLVQWPEMLAGLNEMRKRSPGIWSDNRTANHACLAGDTATLREMLARTRATQFPDHGWAAGWRERCVRRLEQRDNQAAPSGKPNT